MTEWILVFMICSPGRTWDTPKCQPQYAEMVQTQQDCEKRIVTPMTARDGSKRQVCVPRIH